jgi:hypothetical protein
MREEALPRGEDELNFRLNGELTEREQNAARILAVVDQSTLVRYLDDIRRRDLVDLKKFGNSLKQAEIPNQLLRAEAYRLFDDQVMGRFDLVMREGSLSVSDMEELTQVAKKFPFAYEKNRQQVLTAIEKRKEGFYF